VLPAWPNVGWLVGTGLIAAKTRVGSMADGGQFLRHHRLSALKIGSPLASTIGRLGLSRRGPRLWYRQTLGGAAVAVLDGGTCQRRFSSSSIWVSALNVLPFRWSK
jgi:hypothetical protein